MRQQVVSDDIDLERAMRGAQSCRGPPRAVSSRSRRSAPSAGKGLAHDHVRVVGTGCLLRVPRQSQFALAAVENLSYQAACFERASLGAHAPRLHGVLPPSRDVPMGALVVDEIAGRAVQLPGDLPALAECLASIHGLPVPPPIKRPPLADHSDPIAGTLLFIEDQARYLEDATDDSDAISMITEELRWARRFADENAGEAQPTTWSRATRIPATMSWTNRAGPISSTLRKRSTAHRPSTSPTARFTPRPLGTSPRVTSLSRPM